MSRKLPTFSIAIAAFQAAATIGEAVESALGQTRPPVEIVVCDDGSTDELEKALEPFRGRIVFLQREHAGPAAAKNTAARATTADFVAILDADDVYYPRRLEALAELAAERPDFDVLTTNADLELDGEVIGTYYPDVAEFPVDDQPLAVIQSDSAIFSAAAIRRSVFERSGGLNEALRSGDDWELWLRLTLGGSTIGLVDEPLYRYRVHELGTSADQLGGARAAVRLFEGVLPLAEAGTRERLALEDALAAHRRNAALTEAEHALRTRAPERRSRSLAIARDSTFRPRTRLKALFAATLPALSGDLLERRERRTGLSRLRKPMPSPKR
ncbi:MAG TPA: glycosyltransferase [Gaiellaceae bacterium]|nr:glycosyltransferase [Gaiellaceae bacterium]